MQALSLRLTRTYVGTYQHLDKWADIGSIDELGSRELPLTEEQEDDYCEPHVRELFVHVKPSPELHELWLAGDPPDPNLDYNAWANAKIREALHDTYTQHDCHHEHDCCGCRSFYVSEAERLSGDVWRVVVSSSRNY